MKRKLIIGVVGGSSESVPPTSATYLLAECVGRLIAEAGAALLCGGRSGVMEAAARGAQLAGGTTIGILPNRRGENEPPNDYIELPIFTGINDARNYINACAADAVIAMRGGAGTLSEIALAFKVNTPVVYLQAWQFLAEQPSFAAPIVETAEQAVATALRLIEKA